MASSDSTTSRRCPKGHLIPKGSKIYCAACRSLERYHGDPVFRAREKARTRRYAQSPEGKIVHRRASQRLYYKRRIEYGMDADLATYRIIPGNRAETEVRLKAARERHRRASLRYYRRWGDIQHNIRHRLRWQEIRSGEWREEDEHPLVKHAQ